MTGPLLNCPGMLTRVMTPIRSRSWAALREVSLGVARPPSGGDALARDRAVREVGMGLRLRCWVRLRASVLPLVTRVSSAPSSVDSFWIALRGRSTGLATGPARASGRRALGALLGTPARWAVASTPCSAQPLASLSAADVPEPPL